MPPPHRAPTVFFFFTALVEGKAIGEAILIQNCLICYTLTDGGAPFSFPTILAIL